MKLDIRYVTYNIRSGLANRLRMHCLTYAYALKTQRKLVVNWQRNTNCYATYHDLFIDGTPSLTSLPPWERWYFRFVKRFDVSSFKADVLSDGCIVEDLVDLPTRVVDMSNIDAFSGRRSRLGIYHTRAIKSLIPRTEIIQRVDRFLCHFKSSSTVGIHVRLGDFVSKYGDTMPPIERYVAIIQRISELRSNTVFILVSDGDEEALVPLLDTGKCVMRPKANTRTTIEGMQDALADLLILATTDFVVSTPYSSFGGFAAMFGDKPIVRATAEWQQDLDEALKLKSPWTS